MQRLLDELSVEDYCTDDGLTYQPAQLYAYLGRVMYNRRNKMDPLWNSLVMGGVGSDGESFLGMISMQVCGRGGGMGQHRAGLGWEWQDGVAYRHMLLFDY